jgi:hypothetical protein
MDGDCQLWMATLFGPIRANGHVPSRMPPSEELKRNPDKEKRKIKRHLKKRHCVSEAGRRDR